MTDLSYPWVEEYRPSKIDDVVGNEHTISKLKEFLSTNSIPNLLFCGDPGVGKTTIAKILAETICGGKGSYLYINASDRNNIDTIRTDVTAYCATSGFSDNIKIIILDECDGMTPAAQKSLRSVMEEYSKNTRFILTCNYQTKIIDALHSRCQKFEFFGAKMEDIFKRIVYIIKDKKICPRQDLNKDSFIEQLKKLVRDNYPDIRSTINSLQKFTINGVFYYDEICKKDSIKDKLIQYIKEKKIKSIREEILIGVVDYPLLYDIIYCNAKDITSDIEKVSAIIITTADFLYRHATHLNSEMNFVAYLLTLNEIIKG